MENIRKIIYIALAGLIAGFCIGFSVRAKYAKPEIKEVVVYRNVPYSRLDLSDYMSLKSTPVSKVPQVLYIPDTIVKEIVKDSIRYVMLDREFRFLSKDNVDIWYSGVDPSIDSLYFRFPEKTTTQTISATPRKWSLDLNAGVDITRMNGYFASPNVGVDFRYNRWTFGASAGIDIKLQRQTQLTPYVEGSLKYSILSIGR